MFTTKDSKKKPSPFLSYGDRQVLKINKIEIREFANHAMRVLFHMESKPIPGVEPIDGAEGRVGMVAAAQYVGNEADQFKFVRNVLNPLAVELGVKEEVDAIEASNFKDYISKVEPILVGVFARWFISAKEYISSDGQNRLKFNLTLPRYRFVENLDTPSKMDAFDKSNIYHYKPYVPAEGKAPAAPAPPKKTFEKFEVEDDNSDLPF